MKKNKLTLLDKIRRLLSLIAESFGALNMGEEKKIYPPQHDKEKFEALRTYINTSGKRLISVDRFFDGNRDIGSIGCNLNNHPGLETFYEILKSVESRDDVEQVWMRITDWTDTDDLNEWAFCDTVFFIGAIDVAVLQDILKPLQPELPIEDTANLNDDNFLHQLMDDLPPIKDGQRILWVWWD